MQYTFTVPDELNQDYLDGIAHQLGYQETIMLPIDYTKPETRTKFEAVYGKILTLPYMDTAKLWGWPQESPQPNPALKSELVPSFHIAMVRQIIGLEKLRKAQEDTQNTVAAELDLKMPLEVIPEPPATQ